MLDSSTVQHMREVVQVRRTTFYVLECGHQGSVPSDALGDSSIDVRDMLHCVTCQAAAYSRNPTN